MSHTEDTTTIKVGEEPVNSYKLYPRNEEFAKRAGVNTGSQSGGGSVTKPLTYDYMPEGYPKKAMGTIMLMEEQELAFSFSSSNSAYGGILTPGFKLVEGQTYAVNWDGTEYECICVAINSIPCIGNLSDVSMGDDTGEPFVYLYNSDKGFGVFRTTDTAASHTISVKTAAEVITPMAYDYMPEGYPTKSVQTTTLMEEHELAFTSVDSKGLYGGQLTTALEVVEGQKYTVNWDGAEYECVCSIFNSNLVIGNLSIAGGSDNTGEPFLYMYIASQSLGQFGTLDTSASHTISIKRIEEIVTPMAEEFLPAGVMTAALITYDLGTNTYSSDLTYDELYTRLLDGNQIVLYTTDGNEYIYLTRWKKLSSGRIDLAFAGKDYSVALFTDGTIGKKPLS